MNKTYIFKKITCDKLDINDPLWRYIEKAHIDCYHFCTVKGYPITTAQGVYSGKGFTVLWETNEKDILARYNKLGDPAYKDSCVEFFFNPNPEKDDRYFNFEVSAGGALRLGLGTGRKNKIAPEADLKDFEIQIITDSFGWKARIFIPFAFILKYFDEISVHFKGNFQKCGDETACVHFPTWNKIDVPEPDFHQPKFFGNMILK